MVALAYYFEVAVIVATLYAIIRWRGFFSYEGIGFFCCLMMVSADALGIAAASLFGSATSDLNEEIAMRLYPGVVFELGVLAFVGGLFLGDPHPRPVSLPIEQPADRKMFFVAALAVILIGLTFKTVALVSFGVSSLGGYMNDLGSYTVGQRGLGGFLDLGLPFAIVGIAMVGAAARNLAISIGAFLFAAFISFLLSYSRAELFGTLFVFFVVFGITRPDILAFARRHIVTALVLAFTMATGIIYNSGVKSALRAGQDIRNYNLAEIGNMGVERWLDRFSQQGLYDGYCNLVSRLSEHPERLWRGDVGIYAVTSAVPYFLYPSKPVHPFRDIGYLVYDDLRSSIDDVCATTLVGSAYADLGVVTVIGYLLLYGLAVGLLRGVLLRGGPLMKFMYINVIIIEGSTNFIHTGILAFVPALVLNFCVFVLIYLACRFVPIARLVPVKGSQVQVRLPFSVAVGSRTPARKPMSQWKP